MDIVVEDGYTLAVIAESDAEYFQWVSAIRSVGGLRLVSIVPVARRAPCCGPAPDPCAVPVLCPAVLH